MIFEKGFLFTIISLGVIEFKTYNSITVTLLSLGFVMVMCLFGYIGKLLRNNPKENILNSIIISIGAGIVALVLAFATEVGNLWMVALACIFAALTGPTYITKFIESRENEETNSSK